MNTRNSISTRQLVLMALFVALSFVGANLKVMGTIAFDSLPAFLAALVLGPVPGAVIGFLGHMATALTSGFPLSPAMHLVVGLSMGLTMLVFGYSFQKLTGRVSPVMNQLITAAVGTFFNGPVSLGFSMAALALIAGSQAAVGLLAMLPVLVLASLANIVLAFLLFQALPGLWQQLR